MDWVAVREHYRRLFEASGRTQVDVARAAGLSQSAIHKLLVNQGDGPAVETLLRAVQGLGLPLPEFFRQIEEEERTRDGSSASSPLARLDRLEQFQQTVAAEFARLRMEIDTIRRDTGGDSGAPLEPPGSRRRTPRVPRDKATTRGKRDRRIA